MNIIYISSVCSQGKFDKLVQEKKIASQFQNQKFHHLLLSGLIQRPGVSISVISYYPIIRKYSTELQYEEEWEDGIKYIYPKCIDKPIFHHFSKYFHTYTAIKKCVAKKSIIVCNVMNFDECLAAQKVGKECGIPVVVIVADVPGLTSTAGKKNGAYWKRFLTDFMKPVYIKSSKKYDGYMLLTEAMNKVVNPLGKPHIVVEGFSDSTMRNICNSLEMKSSPKVILYAGGIHEEYGIGMLVDSFRSIERTGWELHIYGSGNYASKLTEICACDSKIKYFGTRANQEIVKSQLSASILVNPRPTHEEFIKYSFSSKTLECMASGTPLLTTELPGMPEDYKEHIYLLKDESISGYSKVLSYVMQLDSTLLHQKGLSAKEFVLTKKNNVVQAAKLYDLLKTMIK